jgi:hypothetical protein
MGGRRRLTFWWVTLPEREESGRRAAVLNLISMVAIDKSFDHLYRR